MAPSILRFALSVVGTSFLLASPASAAATDVRISGGELSVVAPGPDDNVIDVRPSSFGYVIDDALQPVVVGPGCGQVTPRRAFCSGFVLKIAVDSGGGDDMVGLWDVAVPVDAQGGPGDDLLESGAGPDTLDGGQGVDTLVGGGSTDRLTGDDGADLLEGDDGGDTLDAGDGDDILLGGNGDADVLIGGGGDDLLRAAADNSTLSGGFGNDVLVGRGTADAIDPGPGQDTVLGADRSDTVDCRAGDRARTRRMQTVQGCRPVPASTGVPRVWPPDKSATAAQVPTPKTRSVEPRVEGDATRFSVWVKHHHTRWVKACIWLYKFPGPPAPGNLVDRFTRWVRIGHAKTYTRPRIPRSSYFGRIVLKKCRHR